MIESVDQLPAALRPREFKVGDRVRIRISAECRVKARDNSPSAALGHLRGHAPWEDGKTGTVIPIPAYVDDNGAHQGHPYLVKWDQGLDLHDGLGPVNGDFYASVELIPLGDES